MLKELVHAGSVVKLPDEKYRVVSKTFIPDPADPEAIKFAGQAVADLLSTINNNLFFLSLVDALVLLFCILLKI